MYLIIVLNLKMAIISIFIGLLLLMMMHVLLEQYLMKRLENVIDKDHVIDALKNGIHLNDYVKTTEN